MCGIVGLFLKNPDLEPRLGALMVPMLAAMTERGPDSAGFAVYRGETPGRIKLTLRAADPAVFADLAARASAAAGAPVSVTPRTTHAVIDTPAGLHGKRLDAVLRLADKVLIPLQPSLFDIQATHAFVQELRAHKRAAELQVGLVGMRVREHTLSNEQLHHYLSTLPVPVVAWLRDTQNYVQLAARGLTLWDVAPSRVERDLEQWAPLAAWIRR